MTQNNYLNQPKKTVTDTSKKNLSRPKSIQEPLRIWINQLIM